MPPSFLLVLCVDMPLALQLRTLVDTMPIFVALVAESLFLMGMQDLGSES
jgi:hypothetical protein